MARSGVFSTAASSLAFVVILVSALAEPQVNAGTGTAVWTFTNPRPDADLRSIVFDGRRFVAVGAEGLALESESGRTWQRIDLSTSEAVLDIAADGSTTLFVTRKEAIRYLPSGELARVTFPALLYVDQIAYGNGRFVGLRGYSDIVSDNRTPVSVVTTNGIDFKWTELNPSVLESSSFVAEVAQIAFGVNRFVAVTFEGALLSSADGIAWSRHIRSRAPTYPGFLGLGFGDGLFVATGYEVLWRQNSSTVLPVTWTSRDGVSWNRHQQPDGFMTGAVGFGNGVFAMIVANTGAVYSSTDGVRWAENGRTAAGIRDVAFGRESFVAVGAGALVQSEAVFRLLTPVAPLSGAFPLSIQSEVGAAFRLQYSSDLKNWIELGRWTNTPNAPPTLDPLAESKAFRFYRALVD